MLCLRYSWALILRGAKIERRAVAIGTANPHSARVEACVPPEWLGDSHPLSAIRGEWNALAIALVNSETTVMISRGAGRWPTTEDVIADLFEPRRECQLKVMKDLS
jgi:homoserine dehydrogenase